jgi:SAM-dependent methyltransferase
MSDWTEGYVADIGYTYGYYAELNPQRIKLAFLNAGYAYPEVCTACELGFGQGISVNVHAAASVTRWYGTDFNPAQAGFAQELAAASGADAKLYDESFEAFCSRDDLPDFDYIGLHGIWSWISDENRTIIADFLRRKLKVGGVLYISYNTQPGWAAMAPLRDLLTEHAELMGVPGAGIVPRIDASLEFAQKVLKTNALYARANPAVEKRLEQIKEQPRSYLAHEYFNRDWLPMSFSRMSGWLGDAKLSYVCSSHYLDHIDAINLTDEQLLLLGEIPEPTFRETVRDFLVNQQFRRDYWVRGARSMSMLERFERIRDQRFVMTMPRKNVTLKATGVLGEADLNQDIYGPVLDYLADFRVRSFQEIEEAMRERLNFAQLMQAIMVLIGKVVLHPVQDDAAIAASTERARKLNSYLCRRARADSTNSALASPLTGGAVGVSRIEQMFLLARELGVDGSEALARYVLDILQQQNHNVLKDGKALTGIPEQLAELVNQANTFKEVKLPILQALRICA